MTLYLISSQSHIPCTKEEVEFLEVLYMVGTLIGLPVTIYLVNRIGRKYSLVLGCIVSLVGWIVVATANNLLYIQISRLLFGTMGNIAFVAAPMYITEIADDEIRGFLSSTIYLMMLVGLVVVYSVGPYTPFIVVPIIAIVLLVFDLGILVLVPESPYYLALRNKSKKAKKSLQYFRPKRNINREFENIVASIRNEEEVKTGIKDLLLAKSNLKAVIITTVLNFGQHMAAISVVLMNIHIILQNAGTVYIDNSVAAIIFSMIMLVSSSIASLQLEKYGRRPLLITSSLLTAICLVALAIYFNLQSSGYNVDCIRWIPIAFIMIYAFSFKLGLGIVPIVITAEVFPPNIKAAGISFGEIMYALGATVSLEMYTRLSKAYGLHAPLYLFSMTSLMMSFFTIFYIPETKGRTLEEIQILLGGKEFSNNNDEEEQENVSLKEKQVV